jgi:drug/metabolite transporter (DMT)-like permease
VEPCWCSSGADGRVRFAARNEPDPNTTAVPDWHGAVTKRLESVGVGMALLYAAAAGTLAILAKVGYEAGLEVEQLLAVRFLLGAGALSTIALIRPGVSSRIGLKHVAMVLLLGALGYGAQSFMFFMALRTVEASVAELVLYLYPGLVVLGGWALYKKGVSTRHVVAVVVSFLGIAFLLKSPGLRFSPDLALALVAPMGNAAYLLAAEKLTKDIPVLSATALVAAGTAAFWTTIAWWRQDLSLPSSSAQWLVIAAFVVGPTLLGIPLLLGALSRIGSSRVALLSTVEPIVTVALAFAFLRERLTLGQLAGAGMIVGAIVLLQLPLRARRDKIAATNQKQ